MTQIVTESKATKLYRYIFFFYSIFCIGCSSARNSNSDIDTIIGRIAIDKISQTISDTSSYNIQKISELINTMSEEDSWPDIDYSSKEPAIWEPRFHIDRLTLMATALIEKKSEYYKDQSLEKRLIGGLKFWVESHPSSSNWWWSYIGEPHLLGQLLLILKYGNISLDKNLSDALVARFPDSDPYSFAGANRSDVGIANLYKSLCNNSRNGVIDALDAIFSSIEINNYHTFQEDGCYFHTNSHLYIGGYAETILMNTLNFAEYVNGTEFTINHDKISIMSNFVRGAYAGSIRGHVMAFNCHGRSVTRKSQLDKSYSVIWLKKLLLIDQENSNEYTNIIRRLNQETEPNNNIKSFTRHFYKGDYTIQQTPNYNVAVRTLSSRTCRDELDNGENLKGYYICDGSTAIARTGREYYNIMPLWDWNYIPGTTAPITEEIPKPDYLMKGTSEFCGGATDSLNAVIALQYFDSFKNINTGAHKGYFLFNEEMICLGSSIESDKKCNTTINQTWYNKKGCDYIIDTSNFKAYNEIDTVFTSELYMVHDSIGYYIPSGQSIRLLIENRTGTWYDINNGFGSSEEVSGEIFQLSLNHHDNDFYYYIIVPNITITELNNYIKDCPITVIENSENVQAVYNKREQIYEMIFYNSGDINLGKDRIHVSSPCLLILKRFEDGRYVFHISDPTQSIDNITIEIASTNGETTTLDVEFPIQQRGSTKVYILNSPTSTNTNKEFTEKNEAMYFHIDGYPSKNNKLETPIIEVVGTETRKIIKK